MFLEYVGYRRIGDVIADVLQCSLNSIVSPRRVLSGEANNGIHDDLSDSWPTGFAFVAGIEFLRDQFAMPLQNRVWRDNGG